MAASDNRVIKRVVGLAIRLGGQQHSGWLPPGAANPLPTPARDVLIDLEIEFDGSGYLLICQAQDGSFCWDTWCESMEKAEMQAAEEYGIQPSQWEAMP